jgi:hypothetical protein
MLMMKRILFLALLTIVLNPSNAQTKKEMDKVYNRNKDLELHLTVDDKRLFMYLFSLDPSEKNKSVKRIINYFVKS